MAEAETNEELDVNQEPENKDELQTASDQEQSQEQEPELFLDQIRNCYC